MDSNPATFASRPRAALVVVALVEDELAVLVLLPLLEEAEPSAVFWNVAKDLLAGALAAKTIPA